MATSGLWDSAATSRCGTCDGPVTGTWGFGESPRHIACLDAWLAGPGAVAERRRMACEAGFHRFPGRWATDPADPYGDAAYWDCAKGCGHRQAHPGYGIGRALAALDARAEQLVIEFEEPSRA